jgi:hypothetical protein
MNYFSPPQNAGNPTLSICLTISLITLTQSPILPLQAETVPLPSASPLELELLTQPNGVVKTSNTIDQEHLTVPSLWLAKESSENKLLDNWIAYPSAAKEPARVDLIVNQQIWALLDYVERYSFVNRLGNTAKNFGYNVRVFNYQQEFLAAYTCNLSTTQTRCTIKMKNQGKVGLGRSL